MGLAEELKQAKPGAPAVAAPVEVVPPTVEEQMAQGMPKQADLVEQVTQAKPGAEVPKETKITIGDKEFTNQSDAIKYAQDIERQRIVGEAYKKGIIDAQPKDQKDAPIAVEEQIQDMLFENPAEALKIYRAEIEKQITSKINDTQTRQGQEKDMWSNFYESNQDLSNHKDLVEFVLEKSWNDVAHIDLEKGLKLLAENARGILSGYKEEAIPRQELESKPAIVPGAGGAPAAPVEEAPQKDLDFITQVKKHRSRTLGEEMTRLGIKK